MWKEATKQRAPVFPVWQEVREPYIILCNTNYCAEVDTPFTPKTEWWHCCDLGFPLCAYCTSTSSSHWHFVSGGRFGSGSSLQHNAPTHFLVSNKANRHTSWTSDPPISGRQRTDREEAIDAKGVEYMDKKRVTEESGSVKKNWRLNLLIDKSGVVHVWENMALCDVCDPGLSVSGLVKGLLVQDIVTEIKPKRGNWSLT